MTSTRCSKCHFDYTVENGIAICACGTTPLEIILPELWGRDPQAFNRLQRYVVRSSAFCYQHRLQWLMEVASQPENADDLLLRARKLPDDLRRLTLGWYSRESIEKAIQTGIIDPPPARDGAYVIPECVGRIITGFLLLRPLDKTTEILRYHAGGVGLGYSIRKARSMNHMFIFQDPYLALQFFITINTVEQIIPPIIISPQMDWYQHWQWIPKWPLVLVVSDCNSDLYQHLRMFDVNLVSEEEVHPIHYNTTELLLYAHKSRPLKPQLYPSVAISSRVGIVARHDGWYFTPSLEQALNIDLRIQRLIRRRRAYHYIATIRQGEREIIVHIPSKKDFYQSLRDACDKHGIVLYCAPRIRSLLPDLALGLHSKVQITTYRPRLRPDCVLLPNVRITTLDIQRTDMAFPGEPGSRIIYTKEPKLQPYTQGQLNQLTVFFAICCALARRIDYGKNCNVVILGDFNEQWKQFFQNLSIPILEKEKVWKRWWPAVYPEYSIASLPTEGMKIYFGDELQALVTLYLSPGLMLAITEEIFPLYEPEELCSALCLWFRAALRYHEDRKKQYRNYVPPFKEYSQEFCRLFKLGEDDQNYLETCVLQRAIRPKRIDYTNAIIGQLLREGLLSDNDVRQVGFRDYIVPIRKVNEILRQRGLAEVFCERGQEYIKFYRRDSLSFPLRAVSSLDEYT